MSNLNLSLVVKAVDKVTAPMARTRAAIKSVQDQVAKVDSFRRLKASTAESAKAVDRTQAAVAALARELKSTSNPSKRLQKQFDSSVVAARKAKQAHQRQTQELARMRKELKGAGIDTRKLASEQRRLVGSAGRLQGRLRLQGGIARFVGGGARMMTGLGRAAMGVSRVLGVVGVAAAGLGYVGQRALRPFLNTAAQFEKYQVMLESIEGSSEKAERSMDWVSEFATRTPLELDQVMGAFVKLRTFGMDPMNGTMQSLVDMNSRMGGSGETLQGIILAVGQAWTKQKLQGEEALQLIERGVPVWDLLAKRSGKTAAELQKMASNGQLGRDAIAALIEEMGKFSKGASEKQMKTWNGLVSNMGDQWTRFKKMVMDTGPFQALKGRLSGVLDTINRMAASGELQRIATQVGTALVKVIDIAWSFSKAAWAVGSAATRVFMGVGRAVIAVVDFITKPLQWLYKLVSWILTGIIQITDKLTGSGISNFLGRATAALMAGLGSEDAQAALDAEANSANRRAGFGQSRPRVGGSRQDVNVDGVLQIKIDAEGRPRVTQMEQRGAMRIEADTGMALAGAGT